MMLFFPSKRRSFAAQGVVVSYLLLFAAAAAVAALASASKPEQEEVLVGPRIAIIGGAVSGSFTAKYVAEFDTHCRVSSITVFEAVPMQHPLHVGADESSDEDDEDDEQQQQEQGTRVQTVRVVSSTGRDNKNNDHDDGGGALVEVGASIGYKEFHLILEHVKSDPDFLKLVPPFSTGATNDDNSAASTLLPLYEGLGIYDGSAATDAPIDEDSNHRRHVWSLNTAPLFSYYDWIPTSWKELASKLYMVWRYGWELRKMSIVTHQVSQKFATIPALLGQHDHQHFFESPMDLWKHLDVNRLVESTFDEVLESMHIPVTMPSWRSYLGHGSFRREFLEAMNLVNYNQDNKQLNALVGFGSFAAAFGGLFAIEGGNVRLIPSAFRQANRHRQRYCGILSSTTVADGASGNVHEVHQRVTTVVATTTASDNDEASFETQFELYAHNQSLGTYDIVVVAAPLQQARIQFYVQSAFDGNVLQPMPLGRHGVIDTDRNLGHHDDSNEAHHHEGHPPFPPDLDPASVRPYMQVVTTLVSNATLKLLPARERPRSIMMTAKGKASLYNITAISQLQHRRVDDGHGSATEYDSDSVSLYKVFSDERLSRKVLMELFGEHHVVEHVKVWPRPYGGATPDYQGGTTSEGFVLFDASPYPAIKRGDRGLGGGVIYYPVAMEQSTLACMELAAIGAKATAKLIARRLGLMSTSAASDRDTRDEL